MLCNRRLILATLLTIWAGLILACGGGGSGNNGATTANESAPGSGESGFLEVEGEGTVWVSIDEKALDELLAFSRKKNQAAVEQMMVQGRVLVCARGTKVVVIDRGFMSSTVRIMEGKHEGKTGIVPNEFLHKPKGVSAAPAPNTSPPTPSPGSTPTPTPAEPQVRERPKDRLGVEILRVRLEPFRAATGFDTKMVCVDWKNTGDCPVRVLKATIKVYDNTGAELYSAIDYTIFVAFGDEPGIGPGQTYTEPTEEGHLCPKTPGKVPVRATVEIIAVTESDSQRNSGTATNKAGADTHGANGSQPGTGATAYDAYPEPERSRYVKDWQDERDALKRAIEDDKARLSKATTAAEKRKYSNYIETYTAKLARHEKNDPPFFRVPPKQGGGQGPIVREPPKQEGGKQGETMAVEVVKIRLQSVRVVDSGANAVMVSVDLKNTGTRPVRSVRATIKAFDAKGKEVYSTEALIYETSKDFPGIAPGATYTKPDGKGHLVPNEPGKTPIRATVEITKVEEKGS